MKPVTLLAFVFVIVLAPAAGAATVIACPTMSKAVRIGTCPTEEHLRYTYHGYCSDNQRMYDGKTEGCADYRQYRALKNTALWESADGEFQAYLSCDIAAERIAAAKANSVSVSTKGRIAQVTCGYDQGFSFARRGHDRCTAASATACATDAANCSVSCE